MRPNLFLFRFLRPLLLQFSKAFLLMLFNLIEIRCVDQKNQNNKERNDALGPFCRSCTNPKGMLSCFSLYYLWCVLQKVSPPLLFIIFCKFKKHFSSSLVSLSLSLSLSLFLSLSLSRTIYIHIYILKPLGAFGFVI